MTSQEYHAIAQSTAFQRAMREAQLSTLANGRRCYVMRAAGGDGLILGKTKQQCAMNYGFDALYGRGDDNG